MSSAKMPVKNSQTTQPNLAITLSASQLRAFALSLYDTFGLNVVPIGANKKPVATWKQSPQLNRNYYLALHYSQAQGTGCRWVDFEMAAKRLSDEIEIVSQVFVGKPSCAKNHIRVESTWLHKWKRPSQYREGPNASPKFLATEGLPQPRIAYHV